MSRNRKNVLLYVGDLDPAGEGIEANIVKRMGFDDVIRVALTWEQAEAMALPENPDPDVIRKLRRQPGRIPFEQRYGRLFQIEVDAVPPDRLQRLVNEAVEPYWDEAAYRASLAREEWERGTLPTAQKRSST